MHTAKLYLYLRSSQWCVEKSYVGLNCDLVVGPQALRTGNMQDLLELELTANILLRRKIK